MTELPVDVVERKQVLEWARRGGGDLESCATWTGLAPEVCSARLAELKTAGLVETRRELRNPFRAR